MPRSLLAPPCLAALVACAGAAATAPRPAQESPVAAAGREPAAAAAPRGEFPSADQVDALARAPQPARVGSDRARAVDDWQLARPPAAAPADAPHPAAGPWDGILAAVAAERQGLVWVSEPMACLAREVGQFWLARQGTPEPGLLSFMASRCGVGEPDVGIGWVIQPLSGGEADADVEARLRAPLRDGLHRALAAGSQAAGLWYGRDAARAVALYVFCPRRARFEPFPEVPGADGRVAVRGELLVPAEHAAALVTHGRHGFRRCTPDPAVRLPRFSFLCEVNPADESARLEVAAFPAGRLTGPVLAAAWLWPGGVRSPRWARPALEGGRAAPGDAGLAAALVEQLNLVRAEAALPPVRLEGAQSDAAAALAPHFFAASAGVEPEVRLDAIVLGLRAGWRVPGLVAEGFFTSALVRERDAGRLLAAALERPSGREALLDPQIASVAVGALEAPAERLVGAVFASYRLVDRGSARRVAADVVRRIDAAREVRGLPPAAVLAELRPAAGRAAVSVEEGRLTPEAAMRALVEQAARAGPGRAMAWFLAADRLDRLAVPEALAGTPGLRLAMGVAFVRRPGVPWVLTGVLVVAAAPPGTVVARATPSGS